MVLAFARSFGAMFTPFQITLLLGMTCFLLFSFILRLVTPSIVYCLGISLGFWLVNLLGNNSVTLKHWLIKLYLKFADDLDSKFKGKEADIAEELNSLKEEMRDRFLLSWYISVTEDNHEIQAAVDVFDDFFDTVVNQLQQVDVGSLINQVLHLLHEIVYTLHHTKAVTENFGSILPQDDCSQYECIAKQLCKKGLLHPAAHVSSNEHLEVVHLKQLFDKLLKVVLDKKLTECDPFNEILVELTVQNFLYPLLTKLNSTQELYRLALICLSNDENIESIIHQALSSTGTGITSSKGMPNDSLRLHSSQLNRNNLSQTLGVNVSDHGVMATDGDDLNKTLCNDSSSALGLDTPSQFGNKSIREKSPSSQHHYVSTALSRHFHIAGREMSHESPPSSPGINDRQSVVFDLGEDGLIPVTHDDNISVSSYDDICSITSSQGGDSAASSQGDSTASSQGDSLTSNGKSELSHSSGKTSHGSGVALHGTDEIVGRPRSMGTLERVMEKSAGGRGAENGGNVPLPVKRTAEIKKIFESIAISETVNYKHASREGVQEFTLYVITYKAWYQTTLKDECVLESRVVRRRYREFLTLQSRLKSNQFYVDEIKRVKSPNLWFKLPFGNRQQKEIEKRRSALDDYLKVLLSNNKINISTEVREFLAYSGDAHIAFVKRAGEFPRSIPRVDRILARTMSGVIDRVTNSLPNLKPDETKRLQDLEKYTSAAMLQIEVELPSSGIDSFSECLGRHSGNDLSQLLVGRGSPAKQKLKDAHMVNTIEALASTFLEVKDSWILHSPTWTFCQNVFHSILLCVLEAFLTYQLSAPRIGHYTRLIREILTEDTVELPDQVTKALEQDVTSSEVKGSPQRPSISLDQSPTLMVLKSLLTRAVIDVFPDIAVFVVNENVLDEAVQDIYHMIDSATVRRHLLYSILDLAVEAIHKTAASQ